MNTQPDLPGMPPAASLARSLRRPNTARTAARIQICHAMLRAGGCRRSLTASPVLELARMIFGLRFTHDDRWTLAGLANLPVPGFQLPADLCPRDEDVRAFYSAESAKAREILSRMDAGISALEAGSDV